MSLYAPPVERVTKRPRLYLLSGVFAILAIIALVVGVSTSLVATTSPATACESGCDETGGQGAGEENGDNHDENTNDSCDVCGDEGDDGNTGDDGNNGDDGDNADCGGCSDEGGSGGEGEDNNGGAGGNNTASSARDPEDPWWERGHSVAANSYRSRMKRPVLFGMRRSIIKERVVYVHPRRRVVYVQPRQRVVYARPRQRVIYVEPRRARVIRPRIVRQARPVYRTRLAVRGARYPTVIYTAPAVRYPAPTARSIIYASGYTGSGYGYATGRGAGEIEAYAARGRVGVRTRRVIRSSRGRVVVKSVSAYAEGRHARVRISGHRSGARRGARIYGALPRRGYASESYIYADDSGADIVTVAGGGRYRAMMTGRYR